jgi:isoquinoline 1-oxidoreductase alpha subunit
MLGFFLGEIPSKSCRQGTCKSGMICRCRKVQSLFAIQKFKGGDMAISFNLNGKAVRFEGDPETPILWVLRDHLDVTSPKYGCGAALCGACTVHLEGGAIRSCSTPVSAAAGKSVTTLEGLPAKMGGALQEAWIEFDVPQCGYCQTGQMMSAADLLSKKAKPNSEEIKNAMSGNICRCGTYARIEKAVKRAADKLA